MPASQKHSLSQSKDDLSRHLRSASPAVKRPASDMGAQDRESYNSDVEMGDGEAHVLTPSDPQASPDTKAKQQDTGQRHRLKPSTDDSLTHQSEPRALRQNAPSDNSAGSAPDSLIPSPSNQSTAATSLNTDCFAVPPSATSVPTLDEQVAKITQIGLKEPQEGDKGYLISTKWLVRVQARSVFASDLVNPPKSATEGEIGPVDNSDLAMVIEDSGKLLDEAGEPYVPLRPGLSQGEDYHILPQEAWDLIISWYGLAKDSPVLTRYAHDSQADGAEVSNVIYELNPPIFSFLKVPSEHTSQTQREKELTPQRLLASKKKPFMQWLKEGKELLHIDLNTKVRVWRILGGLKNSGGSGVLTPAASRSASPAPGAEIVASAGDRMLLDVNTFASLLIGEHRELLEIQDQTGNSKYNGSLSLGTAGLGRDEVICLEEQKSGKEEWPSESSKLSIKGLKTTAKNLTASGRTSPAPGMVTRGRQKQAGRPRGITGLSNLGNTCYMNSALQCIRSVKELTDYFLLDEWKKDLNVANVLGHRGEVARAYATLLHQINDENSSSTNPVKFKAVIGRHGPSFSGYQQQDSQEFLLFLLDGLQEDLNRVLKKPYVEKPDSTDEMVRDPAALKEFADKNWEIYKARNDSVVTDLFAGMYKSTLTCPVCDKVSIIFDPFNNLTLQLPVENNWSKEVLFFPLHKRPFRIDVDVDKHSSITTLKEFVAKRTGADVQRLLVAESYKNKIYKIFDNNTVISEANIQPADIICVYELNAVPTNYNPNKVKKYSLYTIGRDTEDDLVEDDSPDADSLLVPMYNRLIKNPGRGFSKPFFGQPTYLVLNREDRASLDGVLKKVFGNVLGMTTTNLLSAEIASDDTVTTPEGSDTVLMADDISTSDSNTTTAASVQGEDGLVDVSMRDASQAPETSSQSPGSTSDWFHRPGANVPQSLKNLFTLHVASTGEGIPTGWNMITESMEYDNIEARIPKSVAHRPARTRGSLTAANGDSGSATSEDELAGDAEHDENIASSDETSSESTGSPMPVDQESDNELTVHRLSKTRNPKSKRGKRQRNKGNFNKKRTQRRTPPPPPQPQPKVGGKGLIRPGEAIVLDWNAEAFESLFGGSEASTDDSGEFQGAPTWKSVELYHDAELVAKRSQRNSRKKNGISLDDCLAEFGKAETLSEQNAWYCPRCKEHRRADKTYELWKVPDILVMHLKRFSSNRNFRDKLEVKVEYPTDGLDLNGMVRGHEEGQSLIYDLIAVDNHYGGLGGGHYTAYAKNSVNNNWYEYNDSHVSQRSDERTVVTSAAYLLFYRRRETPPGHPLGGPQIEAMMARENGEADSENPQASREPSPVSGEGRRLGDFSHNGSSSALAAGQGHRVGAVGSAMEEENPSHDRQAETASLSRLIGPTINDELPSYSEHERVSNDYSQAMMDEGDEGVDMSYGPSPAHQLPWDRGGSWSFDNINSQSRRAAPSEDGMFGDNRSSNDSTRVEGNIGSPHHSLTAMDDLDEVDNPIYSEPVTNEDYDGRGMRESAPPPEIPGMNDMSNDDEDDLPVMELKADPSEPSGELRFRPKDR